MKIFSLILALFLFTFCIAQKTHFGAKAGTNYSSVVGDLTQGIKFRFSGHAGVFLEIEYSDKFSLKPEIVYSSQGFQFSSDLQSIQNGGVPSNGNEFRTNVQFNYLSIPVLGKFALNNRVFVEFGPQFGFLLNQITKTKLLDQGRSANAVDRSRISGDFRLDYGASAGLAIRINEKISFAPRFYISLRNRLDGIEGDLQNYNVLIQLSANYFF